MTRTTRYSGPRSALAAPASTPACPARKCKLAEGHDDGVHGRQRRGTPVRVRDKKGEVSVALYSRRMRRAGGRTGMRSYDARVVPGHKLAPYDPATPRASVAARAARRARNA